ncbi:hypothetical protein P175DRAFT_0478833 [Aspergillus ochraceoroseus IBT 24754]|uniref:Uncharacterized protein n=1 Tax=Aspergillus ochraceoroseus IBT 24754 TaxID=1392256 RepID=A0A2T5LWS8_9EURO|nr:uncharacterized protein P175DRAFT_0478833 [Aspergillus ochraceoroseus IBT 24754]PTU20703.1 hypothetical protein P175DRAFT_0478833 [Aspergillus ochraceoroseus IBT 24754]
MLSTNSVDEKTQGLVSKDDSKYVPENRRTQSFRRHCARFWWCYLFSSIIFLAIFLPILFLVITPAIARLVVNKSTLLLVEATVLEPRADSILLAITSKLSLPIAVPVRIDPITLELFNRDLPGNNTFAKVSINSAAIKGETTLRVQGQHTPLNAEQWAHYVHQAVFQPHAPLSVRGSTNAYLGKLKSHVTINKDIPQNTLNSFAGFSIENPKLLIPAREDGVNLIANATLPNPSVMNLQIGTTVFDLKSSEYLLGNVTIDNLYLKPGNHSNPMTGILDIHFLIEHLTGILGTQADSLKEGHLTFQAVGRSVTWAGAEVPYYTDAIKALTLQAQVPLGSLIINTLREIMAPNGTSIFHNLTDPSGPTNIQDILDSLDEPDGSL